MLWDSGASNALITTEGLFGWCANSIIKSDWIWLSYVRQTEIIRYRTNFLMWLHLRLAVWLSDCPTGAGTLVVWWSDCLIVSDQHWDANCLIVWKQSDVISQHHWSDNQTTSVSDTVRPSDHQTTSVPALVRQSDTIRWNQIFGMFPDVPLPNPSYRDLDKVWVVTGHRYVMLQQTFGIYLWMIGL